MECNKQSMQKLFSTLKSCKVYRIHNHKSCVCYGWCLACTQLSPQVLFRQPEEENGPIQHAIPTTCTAHERCIKGERHGLQGCRTHHCCPEVCSCVVAPVTGLQREVYVRHILCNIWLAAYDICRRKFGEAPLYKVTGVSCRGGGGG